MPVINFVDGSQNCLISELTSSYVIRQQQYINLSLVEFVEVRPLFYCLANLSPYRSRS